MICDMQNFYRHFCALFCALFSVLSSFLRVASSNSWPGPEPDENWLLHQGNTTNSKPLYKAYPGTNRYAYQNRVENAVPTYS